MSRRDKINGLIDCPPSTKKLMGDILTLIDETASTKSEYQKGLEKMVSVATDEAQKKMFTDMLAKVESTKTIDVVDVVKKVSGLGLDVVDIIRKGLSKHVNSVSYPYTPAAKEREKKETANTNEQPASGRNPA